LGARPFTASRSSAANAVPVAGDGVVGAVVVGVGLVGVVVVGVGLVGVVVGVVVVGVGLVGVVVGVGLVGVVVVGRVGVVVGVVVSVVAASVSVAASLSEEGRLPPPVAATTIAATKKATKGDATQAMTCFQRGRLRKRRQGFIIAVSLAGPRRDRLDYSCQLRMTFRSRQTNALVHALVRQPRAAPLG